MLVYAWQKTLGLSLDKKKTELAFLETDLQTPPPNLFYKPVSRKYLHKPVFNKP
jgi:hypothetical protein